MPVITVARQYGAGGSSVARVVAERIGAEVVDKALIAEVARRAELPPEYVQAGDERPSGFLQRLIGSLGPLSVASGMAWEAPYPDPAYDPRSYILDITRKVILEVARAGNVVIVGRGAFVVLKDRRDVLHVFLYAEEPIRIQAVMDREAVSERVARRRIHETDANRAAYLRQVHGVDWRDPLQYNLMLNTGALGYERIAETILAAAGYPPR